MCTTHHGSGTAVTDQRNNAQHQLIYVILLCSSSLVHYAWWRPFCIKGRGAVQPFAVFQIILTVDNKAHEFVLVSAFAERLTNYLNSRSPVCSILHVYDKTVNKTNNKDCFVSHPANQSNFSCWDMQKCLVYRSVLV